MEFVNFGIRASDLKMNALMKMYLRRCLCIYMALYFISCTPSHSQQSFLIKDTISNIKKVAIIASANSPDVTYESGNFDTAIAFFILLGAIPAIAVTVDDNYQASNLKEKIYLSSIDDKIINAFIDPLRKASCFDRFEYIKTNAK